MGLQSTNRGQGQVKYGTESHNLFLSQSSLTCTQQALQPNISQGSGSDSQHWAL